MNVQYDEDVLLGRNDAVDTMNTIEGDDPSDDELQYDNMLETSDGQLDHTDNGWTCHNNNCGFHNPSGTGSFCKQCGGHAFGGLVAGPAANEENCPHCTARKPIHGMCPACMTTEQTTAPTSSVVVPAPTVSQLVSFFNGGVAMVSSSDDNDGPKVSVSTQKRAAKSKVTAHRKIVKAKASHTMKLRSSNKKRKLRSHKTK